MVYFLDRSDPSFFQAPLAQWMLRSIAVTDAFPRSAVSLVDIGRTAVLVVLAVHQLFMFLAILAVRQPGASGISTAALWFSWHPATSFGHKESPRRIAPTKAVCPYAVFDVTIIPRLTDKSVHDITHASFL